jgi:hypothetical protein
MWSWHNSRMRGLLLASSVLVAGMIAACRHAGVPEAGLPGRQAEGGLPAGQDASKEEIVLADDLAKLGADQRGAWLAYGLAKSQAVDQRGSSGSPAAVDDFDTEYAARAAMVDVWKELRVKHGGKDAYLDVLATVKDRGMLDEYVALTFARPGWTIPAPSLRALHISEFVDWAGANLGRHEAPTFVQVHKGALPQSPAVPGDTLPLSQEISPERFPCQQVMRRLGQARQAWLVESKALAAAPLAAADARQFAGLLRWASEHAGDYPSGVIWVSPKAYAVTYFAGYCAVDAQDYPAAVPLLRAAVALSPLSSGPRSELAQALVATKQLDAAMNEVDRLLALPMGKCSQGIAWRKRGFILFEMGKLKAAYEAYQKSLEFDPSSQIALSELTLLARELLRTGQITSGESGRYSPPPSGPQVTTRCVDGE